ELSLGGLALASRSFPETRLATRAAAGPAAEMLPAQHSELSRLVHGHTSAPAPALLTAAPTATHNEGGPARRGGADLVITWTGDADPLAAGAPFPDAAVTRPVMHIPDVTSTPVGLSSGPLDAAGPGAARADARTDVLPAPDLPAAPRDQATLEGL